MLRPCGYFEESVEWIILPWIQQRILLMTFQRIRIVDFFSNCPPSTPLTGTNSDQINSLSRLFCFHLLIFQEGLVSCSVLMSCPIFPATVVVTAERLSPFSPSSYHMLSVSFVLCFIFFGGFFCREGSTLCPLD